jgi:UDP-hydrolysing UDP-N-acetyl-D-glucosamine 2-epimerase
MRKIAAFTATRAEYGLLYWTLRAIADDPDLTLQLIVSGSHLSPAFGSTYVDIEADGFNIDERVEMLLSSDSPVGVAKSASLCLAGVAEALQRLQPELLVVLGDRYEALAAVQAALLMRVPVLHLQGGELSEGAYDELIRHAITKMSVVHCTSTEANRRRVVQMGEAPGQVHNVGAPGIENIVRSPTPDIEAVKHSLGLSTGPYILVTYHPETLGAGADAIGQLLSALDEFPEYQTVITYPNADDGSHAIIDALVAYSKANEGHCLLVKNLGMPRYIGVLRHASCVVGNSSSGIIEAPAVHTPTVNIGDRQLGREAAASVLHCGISAQEIAARIGFALGRKFSAAEFENPYGDGNVSDRVVEIIKASSLSLRKSFNELGIERGNAE